MFGKENGTIRTVLFSQFLNYKSNPGLQFKKIKQYKSAI